MPPALTAGLEQTQEGVPRTTTEAQGTGTHTALGTPQQMGACIGLGFSAAVTPLGPGPFRGGVQPHTPILPAAQKPSIPAHITWISLPRGQTLYQPGSPRSLLPNWCWYEVALGTG